MKIILLTISLLVMAPIFIFCQTSDEVISLLHEIDDRSTRFNNRIISISDEFNFGIPGGINWLIEWEGTTVIGRTVIEMIYVVDVGMREILFRENISGYSKIGDFSGEGFDMILFLEISGMGSFFSIDGFDPQIGRIRTVTDEFLAFDERDETPPVRFVTYRGMQGFIFRYFDPPQVAGGPTWVPDPPNPRAGRWFFHTWDREQFTFVEIGEVDEAYIEGEWRPGESPVVELIEQTANEFSEVPNESETANITITPVVDYFAENQPIQAPAVIVPQADFVTEGGGMLLWAWFAIIGGVVVAGVAVLVVVQRKKK